MSHKLLAAKLAREAFPDAHPCEICGSLTTHRHHEDYSKPLDIRWLCSRHHAARHKERRETGQDPKIVRRAVAWPEIESMKAQIVRFAQTKPIAPSRLAKAAGLNKNTLAKLGQPEWSPSAETLHKLLVAMRRLEA